MITKLRFDFGKSNSYEEIGFKAGTVIKSNQGKDRISYLQPPSMIIAIPTNQEES